MPNVRPQTIGFLGPSHANLPNLFKCSIRVVRWFDDNWSIKMGPKEFHTLKNEQKNDWCPRFLSECVVQTLCDRESEGSLLVGLRKVYQDGDLMAGKHVYAQNYILSTNRNM